MNVIYNEIGEWPSDVSKSLKITKIKNLNRFIFLQRTITITGKALSFNIHLISMIDDLTMYV